MLLKSIIEQDVPSFRVGFKDQSFTMKMLGFLAAPFNPEFMTKYITTWGTGVYFPDEAFFLADPAKSFRILAHEYVHLWDAKQNSLFKLSYMFPQVLALLPLMAYAVLAWPWSWIALLPFTSYILGCGAAKLSRVLFWIVFPLLLGGTAVLAWYLTGWLSLVLLGAVLFLVPWPAPWRVKWELRGYGMNVALAQWLYGNFTSKHKESIIQQFTGPAYFCMSWSKSRVSNGLDEFYEDSKSGELQEDRPYGRVFSLLRKS